MENHNLTDFQRDLLFAVADLDDAYGLAIKRKLEDQYDRKIFNSYLCQNLDILVHKGLLEKGQNGCPITRYTPSSRGTREVDKRRSWNAGSTVQRANPELEVTKSGLGI